MPLGLAQALRPRLCGALFSLFPFSMGSLHFASRFAFLPLTIPQQIQLPAVCFHLKKLSLPPCLFTTTAFIDQAILRQHFSDARCAHLFMPGFSQPSLNRFNSFTSLAQHHRQNLAPQPRRQLPTLSRSP